MQRVQLLCVYACVRAPVCVCHTPQQGMAPERLAALLAAQHGLAAPPHVVPYNAATTGLPSLAAELKRAAAAAAAAAEAVADMEQRQGQATGVGSSGGAGAADGAPGRRHMMYVRFETRAALERAVAAPLLVRAADAQQQHQHQQVVSGWCAGRRA